MVRENVERSRTGLSNRCSLMSHAHGTRRIESRIIDRQEKILADFQIRPVWTCLDSLRRVIPSWKRPRQRILTSEKRKKRPWLPCRSSSLCADETKFPYNSRRGGSRLFPGAEPMSRAVSPSPVNSDK